MNKKAYILTSKIILITSSLIYSHKILAAESVFDLGVIDVVAERPIDANSMNGTTLTQGELRDFDRSDVGSAAKLLSGVTLQKSGGRSESLLFVRGFDSRQVPVYLDGVPIYVPYDGNIDLGRLTTFDLSSISVLKGFTSVLYGPNTLGGSVNLVSRKPEAPLEIDMGGSLELDDDSDLASYNSYINAGGNHTTWYWQGSTSLVDRDFFSLPDSFSSTAFEDGGRRENSENRDSKVSFKLGLTPNERDEYAISYQKSQGEKQTPLYAGDDPTFRTRFWQWPEYDKESIYFIAKKGLGETEKLVIRTYYDSFKNTLSAFDDENFNSQDRRFAFNSVFDDYTWGGSIEFGTLAFTHHDLKFAAHVKTDVHRETDDDFAPQEYYEDLLYSFGVEDTFNISQQLTLISGISYDGLRGQAADDRMTEFELSSDNALNAQLGMLYDIEENLTASASISRRSRFPTLKDRYSFRFGSSIPNADLQSERATNIEVGLKGVFDHSTAPLSVNWGFALFQNKISDAIENVTIADSACLSPPCVQLDNIGEQENSGLEANLTAYIGQDWTFHINYTHLDRDNKTEPEIKPRNTPAHSAFSYLNYQIDNHWSVLASAEYNDERFNETDASRIADGFVIGNLKAIWAPNQNFTFEASVNNIADVLYAYDEGFFEPGRQYLLTTRYQY